MGAAAELGRNPVSKHQIQPEYVWRMNRLTWDGTAENPSRETKFSGTRGDRGMFIFPVQLTTSRIGNLTRLIHTLVYVMTIQTAVVFFVSHLQRTADELQRVRLPISQLFIIGYCNVAIPACGH